MSNIIPFQFENFSIRTVTTDDGEILFVGKDVAEALGYRDPTTALKSHCRGVQKLHPIVDALGRIQEARVIAEPDVYRLVSGSTLPEAQKFESWVFEEVLPSIRKTGKYEAKDTFRLEPEQVQKQHGSAKVNTDSTKSFKAFFSVAKLLGLDKNAAAISANQATIKTMGTNMLALLGHTHLEAANQESLVFTPSELGLRMGLSGQGFNLLLGKIGFQTKVGKDWIPTESARGYYRLFDTSKKHDSGTPIQQLKWLDSVLPLVKQAA